MDFSDDYPVIYNRGSKGSYAFSFEVNRAALRGFMCEWINYLLFRFGVFPSVLFHTEFLRISPTTISHVSFIPSNYTHTIRNDAGGPAGAIALLSKTCQKRPSLAITQPLYSNWPGSFMNISANISFAANIFATTKKRSHQLLPTFQFINLLL